MVKIIAEKYNWLSNVSTFNMAHISKHFEYDILQRTEKLEYVNHVVFYH